MPFHKELQKVDYSKDRPIIRKRDSEDRTIHKLFYTKSDFWKYEEEWRVLLKNAASPIERFEPESLEGIIFGCEMSREHENQIIEWATEGGCKPKYFRARKNKDKFDLDILEMTYMKIKDTYVRVYDPERLLPDKSILVNVIGKNSFNTELHHHIEGIDIEESERFRVDYDFGNKNVVLKLIRNEDIKKIYYQVLCYDEEGAFKNLLGHIADKVNPYFNYSDEKMKQLLDKNKKGGVDTLWNAYIDRRLAVSENEGFNNDRIAALKQNRVDELKMNRVSEANAKQLVDEIWSNSDREYTYDVLIDRIENAL